MIRAIRPQAMAQDDAAMVSGWNISPNLAYTLLLTPGSSACGVMLFDADMSVLLASGAALVGAAQPCVLVPQYGTAGMVDADLGWHLLITTTGTESPRTIRIGPAVDLPDEIHPIYSDYDLAVARARGGVDDHARYADDISVTCSLGLGAGLGDIVSVPVDGASVVGQVESITWTGTPNGSSDAVVLRRHIAIAPEPWVEPVPIVPPMVADDTGATDAATTTAGNVLTNDNDDLSVVAVNGMSGNVGMAVVGSNGGAFTVGSDGAWTFDPGEDFVLLEGSETATTSVTYHASDGVSESMGTLTVTVSSGEVPVPTDPYWDDVVLCINPSGPSGAVMLTDATGKMVSFMDGTQISTSLGYPTILFDGNLDGVMVPASPDSNFGASNFTIEFMVRFNAFNANSTRLWNPNGDLVDGIDITVASSGYISVAMSSNGSTFNLLNANAFYQFAINTDYYICITRDGGTVKCGVNGTVYTLSTALGTTALYYAGRQQTIGGQQGTNRSLNGHIGGYRVTKGIARDASIVPDLPYVTGPITIPTSDPYWADVTLCINASGADGSTAITDANGKVISVYGNTQIDTSRGYPTMLFDGNQDCIAIADTTGLTFGASNFTIDFHVRKVGNISSSSRLWNCDGDFVNGFEASIDASGNLSCYMSSNGTSFNLLNVPSIALLANNVDYFIRFAREGGIMRCGINGVPYVLGTSLGTNALYNRGRALTIGGQTPTPSRNFNGHLRGVRATHGVARDVTEVPTLPFLIA